jgi:hypothetical protein
MKKLCVTLLLILNFTVILALGDSLIVRISDTVTANSKNGRIEMIKIQVTIFNFSKNTVIINKQQGVTEAGSLTGEYIPNFCEIMDYRGRFRIFVFDQSNSSMVESSPLSVGDYVYFKKNGKLKYRYLEGIDNPKKIERAFRQDQRLRATSTTCSIESNTNVTFSMYIYLGDYQFCPNENYYMVLVYNNTDIPNLSRICIESNKLTLRVK